MTGDIVDDIRELVDRNGGSLYGGEEVTQLKYALQAEMLAVAEGPTPR